ncbi:MAG: isopentenyl-diphosphate Delta-isomerase [Actinomycetota bacterium]|nr:isopentenyl-diphosphate Delta-isomerase [Actinomycetota bacterium]
MLKQEAIVLVDPSGKPIGTAEKSSSHHSDTPLHLAFSCYVFDRQGMFLATQRAMGKKVWPGVWSNSVCGHPAPQEPLVGAIQRRLQYELGITATDFEVVLPTYIYRAPPFQGIIEYEFCPVFLARAVSEPRPNPIEVAAFRWVRWTEFVQAAEQDNADEYSWWCKNQLIELKPHPLIADYSRPASSRQSRIE